MSLTRRSLLRQTILASAELPFAPFVFAFGSPESSIVIKREDGNPISLPESFIGLGYEMSSVATPGLLSAENHSYVALARGLSREGIIRVGVIVADYTRYQVDGTPRADRQNTIVTRKSLQQFAGFLSAIGWKAIWSVNFAQGTIQDAVVEARAVADILGGRLEAIEIGNEVENYARGQKFFRQPPYDYAAYRAEYAAWHTAILKAIPGIRFAAPDTASSVEWVERMAEDSRGDVQLLTTHYYRNAQARGSADQLLAPDARLEEKLVRLRAASQTSGIPWRMCETNSFSGGGLPRVSDTFVGALWTLDFMLLLAQAGCAGVNIETGINQLGFISSYSPIVDGGRGANSVGASYYGMLAFAVASRTNNQIIPIGIDTRNERVTAYALGREGKVRSVVAVNKSRESSYKLNIAELGLHKGAILRLNAPSPESKDGVRFGQAAVDSRGEWVPASSERLSAGPFVLPAMSAAVIVLG